MTTGALLAAGTASDRQALKNRTNELLSAAMPESEYLRRQAETCLRLARTTFDLTTAEKLRYLAVDLLAKAEELDDTPDPYAMTGNGSVRTAGQSDRN